MRTKEVKGMEVRIRKATSAEWDIENGPRGNALMVQIYKDGKFCAAYFIEAPFLKIKDILFHLKEQ